MCRYTDKNRYICKHTHRANTRGRFLSAKIKGADAQAPAGYF